MSTGQETDQAIAIPIASVALVLGLGLWLWLAGIPIANRYLRDAGESSLARNRTVLWLMLAGAGVAVTAPWNPMAPGAVGLVMVGVPAMVVDQRTRRLPNLLTLMITACTVLALGLTLWSVGVDHLRAIAVDALVGLLIWTVPLFLATLPRGGLGRGDLKLAPALGALLGAIPDTGGAASLTGLLLGMVIAGAVALNRALRGEGLQSRMAMGPYLIGGAIAAWVIWVVIPNSFAAIGI